MINSMTAFARAETKKDSLAVTVEIRSYNSRFLDLVLRIPHQFVTLEERVKKLVSGRLTRGRIEVSLQLKDDSEAAYAFEVNTAKARAYQAALHELKGALHLDGDVSLELLQGVKEIIVPAEVKRDLEAEWQVVQQLMNQAIDDLLSMRKREGDSIAADFADRIALIEDRLTQIEDASADLLVRCQDRLKERITALTRGIVEIDLNRIAQESAFLADRSDISEEILRAGSHLKQFREIVDSPEPAGRKLNFLLQELNREFNTIGSKTDKARVNHIVVDVKSELEKLREQVQNVE